MQCVLQCGWQCVAQCVLLQCVCVWHDSSYAQASGKMQVCA